MSNHDQRVPEALVLRWNNRTLRVRCPYCLYSHQHAFSPPREGEFDKTQQGWKLSTCAKQRRSDCTDAQNGGEYVFAFPQTNTPSASCYGWEVNRDTCEFQAVDDEAEVKVPIEDWRDGRTLLPQHQIDLTFDDTESSIAEIDQLAAATDELSLESGGKESKSRRQTADEIWEELHLDPMFRRDMYFSHCVLRELRELESLFRRYPHDRFIGASDEEGNNGVLLAATEENGLNTLTWLQEHGCSINEANHYGRTPLMEAALWGRLETVQYLAHQDANLNRRDGNGMSAMDLAADTARNTKERAQRSNKVYREPSNANRQRERIKVLLQRLAPSQAGDENTEVAARRRAFFDRQPNGKLMVYRPQTLLEPPTGSRGVQLQKAFATLDRGPNYPYVNAMSGYSHPGWPNVLDNTVWTERAEELRARLNLPKNKSAASHVEPQLLAYLLHHHSILHMFEDEIDLGEFFAAMPAYIIQPTITVSKENFCPECDRFFDSFKRQFPGFNVVFHFVGDSVPGRERS